MEQLRLDGSIMRHPNRLYKRNYKFCKKPGCNESILKDVKGGRCQNHALENLLDHQFGLDQWTIPNVENYYKAKRRKEFEKQKNYL